MAGGRRPCRSGNWRIFGTFFVRQRSASKRKWFTAGCCWLERCMQLLRCPLMGSHEWRTISASHVVLLHRHVLLSLLLFLCFIRHDVDEDQKNKIGDTLIDVWKMWHRVTGKQSNKFYAQLEDPHFIQGSWNEWWISNERVMIKTTKALDRWSIFSSTAFKNSEKYP